jgi:UDP-N-acetylglucosamine 2-epimerase (non-hydrolysing)/GDP/UDP-N,N'-diacetylbacillosamine 2-epimerase (hydrolysing)
MKRRIVSITGTRADYGPMEAVHRALSMNAAFDFHLIVTGMHLLPAFQSSLERARADAFGALHEVPMLGTEDTGRAMAQSIGKGIFGISDLFETLQPDIALVYGDRSEMFSAAIAATHMNIPLVHLSGGDVSGTIDDSVRNAISKLAHFHLPNCQVSAERLVALGESKDRIVTVGEPGLDLLRTMEYEPLADLMRALCLPIDKPFLIATVHPVTDEPEAARAQMKTTLEALEEIGLPVVFTYPNTDHGGRAMVEVLESWRGRPFLRIEASLGSRRYLSLMKHAAAMVGNSSSGIFEAPSFKVPVVNLGSRQHGRVRANNVIDAPFECDEIVRAIRFVLEDIDFRKALSHCENPYGDGGAAERVADILARLRLEPDLIAKWLPPCGDFLAASSRDV